MKLNRVKIDILLAQKNMSITKLAELSGISRQNLSTIKHRGTCQPLTASKLAHGLGVDVTELLADEEAR